MAQRRGFPGSSTEPPFLTIPPHYPGPLFDPPPPYAPATEPRERPISTHNRPQNTFPIDLCMCEECHREEARGNVARKERLANMPFLSKLFTISKILILPPFLLTLGYKIIVRLSPVALVKALFFDVWDALSAALRLLFVWPLEFVGIAPGWFLGQGRLLFQDVKIAAGFIFVFARIAARLGGAYVGIRYVLPFLLTIFVVWPIEIFIGAGPTDEERAAAAATNMMAALLAERAAATERERERGGRANRRRRNRRQQQGNTDVD